MSKSFNARTWLRYAEEDLTVAELLFRHGFHRHALFWVEQASEKIIKTFIMTVFPIKRIVAIAEKCVPLKEIFKNRKKLVKEFGQPKSFKHICEEKNLDKLEQLFDIYQKVVFHPDCLIALLEYYRGLFIPAEIRDKIKKQLEMWFQTLKMAAPLIAQTIAPKYKRLNAKNIVQSLQKLEECVNRTREIISNLVQSILQDQKTDEIVENTFSFFSQSVAILHNLVLHRYLCQFYPRTRYPDGGREIFGEVVEFMPQFISLLRRNLERVRKLSEWVETVLNKQLEQIYTNGFFEKDNPT